MDDLVQDAGRKAERELCKERDDFKFTPDQAADLAATREYADKLNAMATKATEYIAAVEHYLEKHHVGVDAKINLSDDPSAPDKFLFFTKVEGKWHFAVKLFISWEGLSDEFMTPLCKTKRMTRIVMSWHIPALLKIIRKEVEGRVCVAEEAGR